MKKIEAVIQKFKLTEVRDHLQSHDIYGMTVYDVHGFGHQKGHKEFYRGVHSDVQFVEKIKIEIVVEEAHVEKVVDLIVAKAHTGKVGDGKIFISTIDDVVRIRTGERKKDAI